MKLLKVYFKQSLNIIINSILYKKYIFKDTTNRRESREFI